jgi:hypothetical protein
MYKNPTFRTIVYPFFRELLKLLYTLLITQISKDDYSDLLDS